MINKDQVITSLKELIENPNHENLADSVTKMFAFLQNPTDEPFSNEDRMVLLEMNNLLGLEMNAAMKELEKLILEES